MEANSNKSNENNSRKIVDVKLGQALPKEVWLACAERMAIAASVMCEMLRQINSNGMGAKDAEECATDFQLAIAAITYVAECESDKVRVLAVPNKPGHGKQPKKEGK